MCFCLHFEIDLLLQVTMVGGHVVEFREDGEQIVALHTIPWDRTYGHAAPWDKPS